ncbi:MAG: hypothetical protein C4534_01210 [Gaiellales bacterium]|nr:MAG: hypothetical protein C4534_01210 [Gaiellales bacterium]
MLVVVPAVIALAVGLDGCELFGPRHSIPDLRGTYIAHNADIQADPKTVDAIISAFRQAEAALQRGDLDAVMMLYAKSYKHHGYNETTLRGVWKDLFKEYHDFSATHVFSRIKVEPNETPPTAQITCTGSLWGLSKRTGERVNIDSWFGEVHYMVYENGSWRMYGHAWENRLDKETRSERPPHPFF